MNTDVRFALRSFGATPGISAIALLTIAIGIGASAAIFSVHRAVPMAEVLGRGTRREQFALVLMASFAGMCLLLAGVGLYGVLAYAVRQRTQEIGIRIALGATAAQIRLTVLRLASGPLVVGLVLGTAGALLLGRWLTSLAFGISPSDPRIVVAAAVVLTLTGLLAAWLPARRAARIEPRVAIQEGLRPTRSIDASNTRGNVKAS